MAITTNTLTIKNVDRTSRTVTDSFAITASDTNFIEHPDDATVQVCTRGISVETAGEYTLVTIANARATAVYLASGVIHPINVIRVNSTGAASTDGIVGHL